MWAAGTASVLLTLAFCGAEDLPLKWSKPASERTNGDWVPLSADQLGQATARSLGPPPQQNHLVHGTFQQANTNSFAQPFHQQQQGQYHTENVQQQHFRPESPNNQEKFIQPHILSQQFLPPQIPSHLIAQQLSPQFLNQQFESNFNPQFPQNRPILRPQFVISSDQFNQQPILRQNHQHSANEYVPQPKHRGSNYQNSGNIPPQHHTHSFSLPQENPLQSPKVNEESLPGKKEPEEEKEEVQILYVPVETLKQRGRGISPTKASPGQVTLQQPIPAHVKETKKFRHPIQPLKEQTPAVHLRQYSNIDSSSQLKSNPIERPLQEYDSVKDTSQQITTSQLRHNNQENKFIQPTQQSWDENYSTQTKESSFRNYENDKDTYNSPKDDVYHQFSETPTRSLLNKHIEQHPTEVYQAGLTSKLPPPNQPPLSVYMETSPNSKVGDVLSLLKDAKTIPVLDTIGPDSPQVFVGPSNLKPPHGYVKFELPYLSSLDGNRVERKVLQLPFFVAPLNFQPPPGYSKIPFPPPHIGSVVLSNSSSRAVTEKYADTPFPSSTFRDPYTIPADISSISPQLPSLINSLQEEQLGITTTSSISTEAQTEPPPTETTPAPTRRPHTSRRNNFRGSQRAYSTSTTTAAPATRRPYGQRQRRPYNGRTQSRFTTTTTTEETQPITHSTQSYSTNDQTYVDQISKQDHHRDEYSNINTQSPTQSTDDSIATFVSKQAYNDDSDQPHYNLKHNAKNTNSYPKQEFIPQYNTEYVQTDYITQEPVSPKVISSNQHFPNFQNVPQDRFNSPLPDTYQSDVGNQEHHHADQKLYSPVNTQFPSGSVLYEQNRQSIKSNKEETLPAKHYEDDFATTEPAKAVQYKESQNPPSQQDNQSQAPQYSIADYRPKDSHYAQPHHDKSLTTSPLEINPYKQDFSQNHKHGSYEHEIQTTQVYEHTPRAEYQDYTASAVHEKEPVPTPAYNNREATFSVQNDDMHKPIVQYNAEEQNNHRPAKHRLRGRPSQEQKSFEYDIKTTSEHYVETTTPTHTERPTHNRGRSRVRGRPLYARQKVTTEPPNYPSIYTENKDVTPTESYKDEKKVNFERQYSTDTNSRFNNYENNNEYSQHTTQMTTTEATTRATNKKFSHSRTINRRPIRPTTTVPPAITTTSSPSGSKYLIRTRRPVLSQTKLHTGRSRIRRPTTPTTTTTTEETVTEVEKWTVPQLYNSGYNNEETLYKSEGPTKLNQYDSFSRSPFTINANSDEKYEQYQTTPLNSPELNVNIRFIEKPKPTSSSYDSEENISLYTTRKANSYKHREPQPTIISYDDSSESNHNHNYKSDEPTRKVNTFKLREPRPTEPVYDEGVNGDVNYKTYETSRKSHNKQREPLPTSYTYDEGVDGDTNYKPYETTRKSHTKQREPSPTLQTYDDSGERNLNYKQSRTKQRNQQPTSTYHEENYESNQDRIYETTKKPHLSRHREPQTTPAYIIEENKTNYKTFETSAKKTEPQATLPPYTVSDDSYNQHYKTHETTRKSPVYKPREQPIIYEDKYIPERSPALIPDKSYPDEKYQSKAVQQKEAEDFWNQAVTIQQSKSYVYMPDAMFTTPTPHLSKSSNGRSGTTESDFSEYDDYFNFQDAGKFSTSDQSPFPSNDQQVTYTGVKPGVNVGKASQYPEKEGSDGAKSEEISGIEEAKPTEQDQLSYSSQSQIDNLNTQAPVTENIPSSYESPVSEEIQSSSTKKPGRRRGMWVRVRVKKPKDVFETAESQRFGSLTSNSLQGNQNYKIDSKVWDTIKVSPNSTAQEALEKAESIAVNGTNSQKPTVMEQFQNTLTSMIKSYMNNDEGEKNDNAGQAEVSTISTTEIPDLTTIVTTTEEDQRDITTEQTITVKDEIEEIQTTTDVPNTSEMSQTYVPKVLGTSTTTEISLETEICFRGRCVKTKRTKGKDESDLMTVE